MNEWTSAGAHGRAVEFGRRAAGTTLALLALLVPRAASSQEAPPPSPLAERAVGVVEGPRHWFQGLNEQGLYPKLGSFAEGSGAGPGVSYWRPGLGPAGIDVFVTAARSLRGELYEVRLGRVPHRPQLDPPRRDGFESLAPFAPEGRRRQFLYLDVRRREVRQDLFAGPAGGERLAYQLRDAAYDLVGGYELGGHLALSARVGFLSVSADGTAPLATSPGRSFVRVATELAFDDRDGARNPHRGSFVSLSLARFDGTGPVALGFSRVSLDARRFTPLGSPRHVLAVRSLASLAFASEGRIPFYLQEGLGGSTTLRGYDSFRFRGDKLLAVSAEYRFEALPAVELAAFGDAGQAWGGPGGGSGLRTSFGLGVRLKTENAVLLRLDAARSADGVELHLKLGYSF